MSLRNVSRIPVHTGLAAWSEILGPARRRAPLGASTGCAVAIVGARPPISPRNLRSSAAAKNLSLSFEYLGTVTDVASAAVCSGLCQQFVAGADNAGGEIMGVTEFGTHTVSGRAG